MNTRIKKKTVLKTNIRSAKQNHCYESVFSFDVYSYAFYSQYVNRKYIAYNDIIFVVG